MPREEVEEEREEVGAGRNMKGEEEEAGGAGGATGAVLEEGREGGAAAAGLVKARLPLLPVVLVVLVGRLVQLPPPV